MADEGQPKIIVDDDWKNQAQAEREKLAQAEQEREAQGAGQGKLPPADFRALTGMLAMQGLMYLGGYADPRSGQAMFDPEAASHIIDLLGVLEEKTKGNLDDEELKELQGLQTELRSRFVELTKAVAQQQASGGAGGVPGAGPAPGGGAGPAPGAGGGAGGIVTP